MFKMRKACGREERPEINLHLEPHFSPIAVMQSALREAAAADAYLQEREAEELGRMSWHRQVNHITAVCFDKVFPTRASFNSRLNRAQARSMRNAALLYVETTTLVAGHVLQGMDASKPYDFDAKHREGATEACEWLKQPAGLLPRLVHAFRSPKPQ
jgi:hypothetical protein